MCKDCWWDRDPRNDHKEKEMDLVSLNNKFIVEPYKGDRTLKANSATGFAIVQQKVSVVGLTLLMDSVVQVGKTEHDTLPKGSKIYIREELLFTQPWAKNVYESEAVEGKFIMVDAIHVEFVSIENT
jgi:hypothetical protein